MQEDAIQMDGLVPARREIREEARRVGWWYEKAKRAFDITLSSMLLALGLPIWLAAALLIRLTSPGPIILRQVRCARGGRRFTFYKFRTMVDGAHKHKARLSHMNEIPGPAFKLRDDPRVTRVGRWLRRSSIDEIPQLLNVLRGDMSIVGPRPPLPEEVEHYSSHELRRLAVKPGLTCLWQVSGRSLIDFKEWVGLDLEYIGRRSFRLDLLIVLRTIPAVLTGRGAF